MARNLYRIIAHAQSAFAFPEGLGIVYENETSPEDEPVVRVAFTTIWQAFPPFALVPLPVAIQITAEVWADSLDDVVPLSDEILIGFADTIAVCTNAAIAVPEVRHILDVTPSKDVREIRDYFRPLDYPLLRPVRRVPPEVVDAPLRALTHAKVSKEIGLATAHYRAALGFFGTSQLIFAFESLCIAAEILGEPFVQDELHQRGWPVTARSVKNLAKELGHYPQSEPCVNWRNRLYDDVRVHRIFESNETMYKEVGKGTNGFEHGTMPPNDIRDIASRTVLPLFNFLRKAFYSLAKIYDATSVSTLEWAPLGLQPVRDHFDATLKSSSGDVESFGPEPGLAPTLGISQQIKSAQLIQDHLSVGREIALQPKLGEHVEMSDMRFTSSNPFNVVGSATLEDSGSHEPPQSE